MVHPRRRRFNTDTVICKVARREFATTHVDTHTLNITLPQERRHVVGLMEEGTLGYEVNGEFVGTLFAGLQGLAIVPVFFPSRVAGARIVVSRVLSSAGVRAGLSTRAPRCEGRAPHVVTRVHGCACSPTGRAIHRVRAGSVHPGARAGFRAATRVDAAPVAVHVGAALGRRPSRGVPHVKKADRAPSWLHVVCGFANTLWQWR